MMSGEGDALAYGRTLDGLRVRGETVDEITRGIAMRSRCCAFKAPGNAVDVVGTAAMAPLGQCLDLRSFIVAGAGVPVAKLAIARCPRARARRMWLSSSLGVRIDISPNMSAVTPPAPPPPPRASRGRHRL